jgi:glucose/arabinose dehydrogenase
MFPSAGTGMVRQIHVLSARRLRYKERVHRYLLSVLFAPVVTLAAHAAPCPDPEAGTPIPDIALKEVATGLRNPVHITGAGDGSGRLYVVEQAGTIRVIENGRLRPQPFLDISDKVESGGEKGLLSVAFHPRYRENGLLFIYYTNRTAGKLHNAVSRLKRDAAGDADRASEQVLMQVEQPFANHDGGQLAFGPDGHLYIGKGDGGSGNDPFNNGQNPGSLLGKLLRIDVNRADGSRPYAIPKDNPFLNKSGYREEIYALGLRNPWRFSFDAGNGRLYLGDVGQNAREEIDVIEKGGNYGWRIMEGDICTPTINPVCTPPAGHKPPIHVYPIGDTGRALTGGFVYRGAAHAKLCGVYLYGDYVSQRIWGLRYDGQRVTSQRELLHTRHHISSFGQDDRLELYVADHAGGRVLQMVPPKSRF